VDLSLAPICFSILITLHKYKALRNLQCLQVLDGLEVLPDLFGLFLALEVVHAAVREEQAPILVDFQGTLQLEVGFAQEV